jgi:hypothetical protein
VLTPALARTGVGASLHCLQKCLWVCARLRGRAISSRPPSPAAARGDSTACTLGGGTACARGGRNGLCTGGRDGRRTGGRADQRTGERDSLHGGSFSRRAAGLRGPLSAVTGPPPRQLRLQYHRCPALRPKPQGCSDEPVGGPLDYPSRNKDAQSRH